MTEPVPAAEKPTARPPSAIRRWTPTGVLSLVLLAIGWVLSQQLPPIIEGFLDHPPVVASVRRQKTQINRDHKGRLHEKEFVVVQWTDNRGREHRDLLEDNWSIYGGRPEVGTDVVIRYALSPDGSTRLIWKDQHPYLALIALLAAATVARCVVLWIRALRAALRGRPAPAPTPDSGPTP